MNAQELRSLIKESIQSYIREIDKAGNRAAIEAKYNKTMEAIEERKKKIDHAENVSEMADLVDGNKVKDLKKEIKLLERSLNKYKKQLEKMDSKASKKENKNFTDLSQDGKGLGIGPIVPPDEVEKPKTNEGFEVPKEYTHFVVRKSDNKIINGYDYAGVDADEIRYYAKEDFKDMEISPKDYALMSKRALLSKGVDPFKSDNWTNMINENKNNKIKKQFITEAARMQKLAGILRENNSQMLNEEINIQDIKDEMKDFYSLDVSDDDVNDWLEVYHYDRIEDDPDYDGDFVFDTGEREDFYIYLQDK